MSISDQIRKAIAEARPKTAASTPFSDVLAEVASGISSDTILATFVPRSGNRWSLRIAPAYRPAFANLMLEVVVLPNRAEVLLDPKREAKTPEELAKILTEFVTIPEFIESLDIVGQRSKEPVSGFLRVRQDSPSREDVMVVVPPDVQRDIWNTQPNEKVECDLSIALVPGAGTYSPSITYTVLESAGLVVNVVTSSLSNGNVVKVDGSRLK